jgi:hypothetical protein
MKSIYATFVMMFIVYNINSQSVSHFSVPSSQGSVQSYNKGFPVKNPKLNMNIRGKTTESRWYNYATAMYSSNFPQGDPNVSRADRMFPDSTVFIRYADNVTQPVFFHAIAVVLDPTAEIFYNPDLPLNMTLPRKHTYRIDSLGFPCYYKRHNPDVNIVDTLIVELIANLRGPYYSFTGSFYKNNYGFDTVTFCGLKRNYKNLDYIRPDSKVERTFYKILLTADAAADTLENGSCNIYIKSTQTNYFSNLCAATIRFKPGYTWTPLKDTLNSSLNEFMFWTIEETGVGTFPIYTPGNYNQSQNITTQALRPQDSWYKNALYIPTVAFPANWKQENHWIDFKLVCNNVGEEGISENNENNVKLMQNFPNPADYSTIICYESNQANNVKCIVTDLTGNKVMEINKGKQMAGLHYLSVNTFGLANGMYYYTISADKIYLTRKMIISR